MELIPKDIEIYAQEHTEAESELLRYISRETHAKILKPRMLSGHMQGRLLALFSKMLRPERILEIGTYTGYSALCLCEGLGTTGRLITIDANEELEHFVRNVFAEARLSDRIDYRVAKAMDVLPMLTDTFDLVFIDADKSNYRAYYDLILDKVRPGGIILADNVLWSGKVVQSFPNRPDKDTQALLDFNSHVREDPRVTSLLLPIRDGIMIIQKI